MRYWAPNDHVMHLQYAKSVGQAMLSYLEGYFAMPYSLPKLGEYLHSCGFNSILFTRYMSIMASQNYGHSWYSDILPVIINDLQNRMYTAECRCNSVQQKHDIAFSTAVIEPQHKLEFELTNITPYLALTGELWGIYCTDLGENKPNYNDTAPYIPCYDVTLLYIILSSLCYAYTQSYYDSYFVDIGETRGRHDDNLRFC